ncbi:MAG: response regulator [Calothrix sp. CSU_2_0]|nr:response regulator [Calothrix sp. CSU_2_0]
MRILFVDDDEIFSGLLKSSFSDRHYIVDSARDGQEGWEFVETYNYDLIVLDVMLPKLDGISFCRQLRAKGVQALILLLTARDTTNDKIMGLDAGADDYVVKSIPLPELEARIRALLRRKSTSLSVLLEWGSLKLDPVKNEVCYSDIKLNLTVKEYSLLELLMRNNDKIHSQSSIINQIWSLEDEVPSGDTLRTLIKRLRQKLKVVGAIDLIETVYSLGYRLNPALQKIVSNRDDYSASEQVLTNSKKQLDLEVKIAEAKSRLIEQIVILEEDTEIFLKDIFSDGKRQKVRNRAHKLIGSLGILALPQASEIAARIEMLVAEENYQLLRKLIQELHLLVLHTDASKINFPKNTLDIHPVTENNNLLKEGKVRLLIVGDDKELCDRIIVEAAAQDIITVIAIDTQLALEAVERICPDIIVLDISTANIIDKVLFFLERLSIYSPPIPILVLISHDNFVDRLTLARRQVRGFLRKPITPQSILETVNQVLKPTKKTEAKIMILDDDNLVLRFVKVLLEPWGLQVNTLNKPLQFWQEIENITPDLLILDIQMPDINGIELCQMIRNESKWAWIPILILTGDRSSETIQNVFAAGADDFVSKPVIAPELVTRVLNRLERSRLLREQAEIDTLTGLFNRHRSTVDLERLLRLAKQYQQPFCLVTLSIDNLAQINRNYGHQIGDQILRQLAYTLQQELRNEDIIARWDGAEFVVGMYGITRSDGVEWLAEILELITLIEFSIANSEKIHATFSAGVTQFPDDGSEIRTLYQVAGIALEKAKQNGGNRVFSSNWQPLKTQPIPVFDVVLLHQDSPLAMTIMQALAMRGYHAHWLQDVDNIFTILGGNSPSLYGKVILLADNLSKLSGLEILSNFKKDKINRRSKILWLSYESSYQSIEVEQALSLGCFDYINLPCNISAFMQRINQAFQ